MGTACYGASRSSSHYQASGSLGPVLAFIVTINVINLALRCFRRKTRGTPGWHHVPARPGPVYFVLIITQVRSRGEIWRKTRVAQSLLDVTIEPETRYGDVRARAPPDGKGTTYCMGVAGWVVSRRRRVRSLGTSLSCQAWISKRKLQR